MSVAEVKLCFARRLKAQVDAPHRTSARLARRLAIEMAVLLIVPTFAVVLPQIAPGRWWNVPEEQVLVGIIKIMSIALLGFHTIKYAPEAVFRWTRWTGSLMLIISTIYTIYLLEYYNACPDRLFICAFPHYYGTTIIMNMFVFIYMPIFFIQNIVSISKSGDNIGLRSLYGGFYIWRKYPNHYGVCCNHIYVRI